MGYRCHSCWISQLISLTYFSTEVKIVKDRSSKLVVVMNEEFHHRLFYLYISSLLPGDLITQSE